MEAFHAPADTRGHEREEELIGLGQLEPPRPAPLPHERPVIDQKLHPALLRFGEHPPRVADAMSASVPDACHAQPDLIGPMRVRGRDQPQPLAGGQIQDLRRVRAAAKSSVDELDEVELLNARILAVNRQISRSGLERVR